MLNIQRDFQYHSFSGEYYKLLQNTIQIVNHLILSHSIQTCLLGFTWPCMIRRIRHRCQTQYKMGSAERYGRIQY